MNAATFRTDFPEFSDVSAYPTGTIEFYLGLGATMLNADRWGDTQPYGIELFTAHHLVVASREQAAAAVGGAPGAITGPQASKSVDKVSVSYDTSAVAYEGAGFWNMSSYGIRFYQLLRLIGAGGIQL